MIKSFKHKGLKELYTKNKTAKLNPEHVAKVSMVLNALNVAERPEDMDIIGLRFHGLQGKPKRYSVTINGNYRVTFGWEGKDAIHVDYEDYH